MVSQQLILFRKVSFPSIDKKYTGRYTLGIQIKKGNMDMLKLSENIVRLRHKKGITQEELASYIGVTKASVSKWETGLSFPDILLLPELAAFFDTTVDDLIGYEPSLSKEQIRTLYHQMAENFASQPFETVMQECEKLVRKYYSCYPFLLQMGVLWLNHFMIAETPERQSEILTAIGALCEHILKDCKDIRICNDAFSIKHVVDLQSGNSQKVIEEMEEMMNPYRLGNQNEEVFIQAYLMQGEMDKADKYCQINMYSNVLKVVQNGCQYLEIHRQDFKRCEIVIERIDGFLELFDLERLHPNSAACYHYQAAVIYAMHQKDDSVYQRLQRFMRLTKTLLESGYLHGDAFFTRVDEWFEEADLGAKCVRDARLVAESAVHALENPLFAQLADKLEILKSILSEEEK